ncbi:MAG: hypothetical protein WC956_04340 [bacterium]
MKDKELLERLDRIESAVSAKGHMMQDYSTVKMAVLDLISVVREVVRDTKKRSE